MRKILILIFLIAIVSIVLPSIYFILFEDPFEPQVYDWFDLSYFLGIVMFLTLILLFITKNIKGLSNFIIIELLIVCMAQVPPIFLWIILHGNKMADWTYTNATTVHAGYSLLHFSPFVLSLYTINQIISIKKSM